MAKAGKLSGKFAAVVLAALLLLGCAGCGGQSAPAGAQSSYSADGGVLFDAEGVTVTAAGWTTDPTAIPETPIIALDIRNAGDRDLCLGLEDGSVNGFMNDLNLIEFYVDEDGHYYGGNYAFSLTIPANGGGNYALGFNQPTLSMAGVETIGEIALTFTLSEDEFSNPYYRAAPITIGTGEAAEAASLDTFGAVALDSDVLTLVFGAQDYDDFFGPEVSVYIQNKTDHYIAVYADGAGADGIECEEVSYGAVAAPGKRSADRMVFGSPIRERKGFENLTVSFRIYEAESRGDLGSGAAALESVSAAYPPQTWGEYENGGLRLEIKPKYHDLITVETPENDPDGILFNVVETASAELSRFDGAGELFRIGKVSAERLHEMLCWDMSGESVFAKDEEGNFYLFYHPTDVRYDRATNEEMLRDQGQWTMLTEWADSVPEQLRSQNAGLENVYRGNTALDMYLARAAYQDGAKYTLTGLEYGTLEPDGVDGAPYAEFLLDGAFFETSYDEPPDGEFVVLEFPEEDIRFDFFYSEGNVVRQRCGDDVTFYETFLYDENLTFSDVVRGWYDALAEKAGLREPDALADAFTGEWAEKIAGRGVISVSPTLAPDRFRVEASWPNSASERIFWNLIARRTDENTFCYEDGVRMVLEFDENGEDFVTDESGAESGYFYLNDAGELCWHDDQIEREEDSVFIRAD